MLLRHRNVRRPNFGIGNLVLLDTVIVMNINLHAKTSGVRPLTADETSQISGGYGPREEMMGLPPVTVTGSHEGGGFATGSGLYEAAFATVVRLNGQDARRVIIPQYLISMIQ